MQNDLKTQLSIPILRKETLMIIGKQGVGKSLLIQKFKGIKTAKSMQESKIGNYDFELIDTPSYDSYFTLLPLRDQNITGYVIMFTSQTANVLESLKEIRLKLFTNNGMHKKTIVLYNDYISLNNMLSEQNNEIFDIREWCMKQDIQMITIDLKQASTKDIVGIFEKMYAKKHRINKLQKTFLYCEVICSIYTFFYAIWLSIEDPSLIITYLELKIFFFILLCLVLIDILVPYYVRKGIMKRNSKCINRSKLVSVIGTVLSVISLIVTTVWYTLISCIINSVLFGLNGIICILFTFTV